MENIILLLFIFVIIYLLICHKDSLEPFQSQGVDELDDFINNKQLLEEKIGELNAELISSPASLGINDKISQDYITRLDEMSNLHNMQVDDNLKYTDHTINNINKKITTLEKIVDANNKVKHDIKSIQSLQDGLKLNLNPLGFGKYQIMGNDGCLNVKSSNQYNIEVCNKNKNTQLFNMQSINNDAFYNSALEFGLDKVLKTDKIEYPFYVIKSNNTNNCLQNNFGSLSIEPCVVRKGQRWTQLNEFNKCTV